MTQNRMTEDLQGNPQTWHMLEDLIGPDPNLREAALEKLGSLADLREQPLLLYLLATRLLDPELEIRFHAAQLLGRLVDFDPPAEGLPERSLKTLTAFTTHLDKNQLIKLLEISASYLSAEDSISNILKLCSYAGKALGGIVNDRRLPVEIRQQAIFYAGEIGFLSSVKAIRNLVQRARKARKRSGLISDRKKHLDEETLLPFAEAALVKLEGS